MDLSQIIKCLTIIILLFLLLAGRVTKCGQAFLEKESTIPLSSILRRINDISEVQCVLRCRRLNECHRAAMRGKRECLFLSDRIGGGMKCEKDACEGVRVKIYEELVIHKSKLIGSSL